MAKVQGLYRLALSNDAGEGKDSLVLLYTCMCQISSSTNNFALCLFPKLWQILIIINKKIFLTTAFKHSIIIHKV